MSTTNFKKHSGIYTLKSEQTLPVSIEEAWSFFSNPHNLAKITPAEMDFVITSDTDTSVYEGQIISYKVSPMPFMRMNWITEITRVEEKKMFVDEQRFGPYAMWHHEHHFKADGNKTQMTDIVSYKVPFGPLGKLVHSLMIRKQLIDIFTHRSKVMDQLFPSEKQAEFTSKAVQREQVST